MQDGGRAVQATMEESKQTVDEVKMVVAQARRKLGAVSNPLNHFNEDDFMDGMTPSPGASPTKAATTVPEATAVETKTTEKLAKYDVHQPPTTTTLHLSHSPQSFSILSNSQHAFSCGLLQSAYVSEQLCEKEAALCYSSFFVNPLKGW